MGTDKEILCNITIPHARAAAQAVFTVTHAVFYVFDVWKFVALTEIALCPESC